MPDAPLPPHERSWRHPSELGPTAEQVEPSSRRSRVIAFSSGAVSAVLVVTMVVAVTPRRSAAPSAISATTIPAASVQLRSVDPISVAAPAAGLDDGPMSDMVRIERQSVARGQGLALVGAPNAISTAPAGDPDDLDLASQRPGATDRVIVLTSSYTYEVTWARLGDLVAPDGSIVMTPAGDLLASYVDGELRLLVD